MIILCVQCGKEIDIKPSKIGNTKYCNKACYDKHQDKKVTIKCAICGKTFSVPPSQAKTGRKYCSYRCMGIGSSNNIVGEKHSQWRGGKETKTCPTCGKIFKTFICQHGKFCSHECYAKANSGSGSVLWKGGKIEMVCVLCGSKFMTHKAWIKKTGGRFCSRTCGALYRLKHSTKKETAIEAMVRMELDKRGVIYSSQYPIKEARTVSDFFIPPNILIYADGDYWHRKEGVPEKDSKQNFILTNNGYSVFRFWEKDIKKDVSMCIDSIPMDISK